MLTSLFTGTSGLKSNMSSMSVVGNNLSNMNTIGYKTTRASFADLLGQNLTGLQGESQIGLGVMMSDVSPLFSQGSLESTVSGTDLAVEGNGLFVVRDGAGSVYYTRAGQFSFDKDGFIVNPEGYVMRGYTADTMGNISTTIGDLQLSFTPVQPNPTSAFDMVANLDSDAPVTGFVFNSGVNDAIRFTIDPLGVPVAYTASVITDAGLVSGNAYTGDQVANAIKSAMENVTPGYKFSVLYDELSGTFTVTNDATNPSARLDWSNIASTASSLLGFGNDSAVLAPGGSDTNNGVGDFTAGAFDVTQPTKTSNFSTAVTVYDSLGNAHQVAIYFRKSTADLAGNTWSWYAVVDETDSASGNTEVQAYGTLDFDTNGALYSESGTTYPLVSGGFDFAGGSSQGQAITFDFGDSITEASNGLSGITQYGQASAVYNQTQDGYAVGNLQRTYIDTNGVIMGVFSNGKTRAMGQIALATFNNPAALSKTGKNLYAESNSSGEAIVRAAGTPGVGIVHSNTLELSTVDIAEEFVKMITAQRGFQANSRVISTTDEMLAELVNLKR
jgi:flagellar hook protein FlgE